MRRMRRGIFSCRLWKEALWSARMPPMITPVSCVGKKPLGTTMYSQTLPAMTSSRESMVRRGCRSTTARLRS